ncbi:Cu-processing system permease protein [Halomicrobium zhouii]|uniref:Cu-processing system permease protein n=1 Tax=Halomicrobium zhouii TaxID=767519 RepID=A0A1I6K1C5_9EURY|nr:ABC transporter permease [Halomicrobium zhouii]SFR85055.1 Cu-processing system permease protein [Halomicrobium zhouii]
MTEPQSDPQTDGGATVTAATATNSESESATASGLRTRAALATRQVGSLAATEIRLGLRRRWAVILVGLFAAFGMLVLTFAGSAPGPAGFERTAASLAMLAVYVVPLTALAYGYDAVVGPAESGWMEVLSALPVTRTRILAGTALGRGVVLVGGVALGFLIPGGILVSEYGPSTVPALATLLLAAAALGLAFLAVAVALSTLVREKTHALGAALLAWVWFVLVHDLLALGVVAAFDLSAGAVTALVLANPTSVYRVLVLGELGAGGTGGFASVLSAAGLSTGLLAVTLAAWVAVPLVAAAVLVRWRGTIAAT